MNLGIKIYASVWWDVQVAKDGDNSDAACGSHYHYDVGRNALLQLQVTRLSRARSITHPCASSVGLFGCSVKALVGRRAACRIYAKIEVYVAIWALTFVLFAIALPSCELFMFC